MLGQYEESYAVKNASADVRAQFIRKTYLHLAAAILAFIGVEYVLLHAEITYKLTQSLFGTSFGWLGILAGFMVMSWLSRSLATSSSKGTQYAGLALMVLIQAIIFAPLMIVAIAKTGSADIIMNAGAMTGVLFGGLTATVFITRKDFSFLGSILTMVGFIAMGLIVCGVLFGFTLGLWFSAAMIIFAAGAILYDTSKVLHHYREDQYVGASLELFASVALLFWYVLQLLMSRD